MKDINYFVECCRDKEGSSGIKVFDYYGYKTDWCAMFVCYMYNEYAEANFKKMSRVSEIKEYFKERVNYEFCTAEPGDLITFENNGNASDGADHIGIVLSRKGNVIEVVEGNTGADLYINSRVSVNTYNVNDRSLAYIIDMSWFWKDSNTITKDDKKEILDRIHELLDEVRVLLDKIK
jgi:hypothetical protein